MQEEYKRQIEQQLFQVAEFFRAKLPADELQNYFLGLVFFKALSDRVEWYANKWLEKKGFTYGSIKENSPKEKDYLKPLREEVLKKYGYFLTPSHLFSRIAAKGYAINGMSNLILEDLREAFSALEQSTLGREGEGAFKRLFEELDFSSTKLGNSHDQRNGTISDVMAKLNSIDFHIEINDNEDLGDIFEQLIGQVSKGDGQNSCEFYTPIQISKVLAKIVTTGKDSLSKIYDPTCGSASLLLRVAKEVNGVFGFYGQELNRANYNLARMNMILHHVYSDRFDIRLGDSLEDPQHLNLRFEAIVANPLFNTQWSGNSILMLDKRFRPWGRLAPKSNADYAIVQHMMYHLSKNGTIAVVLSHGALFRDSDEGHIRRYLIKDCNSVDAIIGLPTNILHGSKASSCIVVFKKNRVHKDSILFIDASQNYEKEKKQNVLSEEHIDKIVDAYRNRESQNNFSYVAPMNQVVDNNYNLNVSRYVNAFKKDMVVDLDDVSVRLKALEKDLKKMDKTIAAFSKELKMKKT